MKVAILCGGKGTRLREETEYKPKPMVEIGGMPILWHIMKMYDKYGFNDFVLALGYKGEVIRQYFYNLELFRSDVTIHLKNRNIDIVHKRDHSEDWHITFVDTGQDAQTGARIKHLEKHLTDDYFLATYGDAVSDVDLNAQFEFAKKQKGIACLTGVHPHSKWGMIKANQNGVIEKFVEKPVLFDYVNGGFYAFRKEILDYLTIEDSCVLEREPFESLVAKKQISMFRHDGFWHAMDTYKDYLDLNELWKSGPKWKTW